MSKLLGVVDNRIIYALFAAVILIASAYPQILPIRVSAYVRRAYDNVQKAPDGSLIFAYSHASPTSIPAAQDAMIALQKQLRAKNMKQIIVASTEETVSYVKGFYESQYSAPLNKDPEYGKSIVYLGFIPGGWTAIYSTAENIRSIVPKDYFGTPLDNLPMMATVNDIKGCSLYIGSFTASPEWFWDMANRYNIRLVMFGELAALSRHMEYWRANLADVVAGVRGGFEYEVVSGYVGAAATMNFISTMAQTFAVIFLIATNIVYVYNKYARPKEAK